LTAAGVIARNVELRGTANNSDYSAVSYKGEGGAKYRACTGDASSSQPIADNGDGILIVERHGQLHIGNDISVSDCATTVSDRYIYIHIKFQ
jgi:hypothetical protein